MATPYWVTLTRRFHFDAAHYLPNYEGKCAQTHGHRWIVEVTLLGRVGDNGMLLDFNVLKTIVENYLDVNYDHKFLNDTITNPTAENLVVAIYKDLKEELKQRDPSLILNSVRLYESPDSWVEYPA